MKFTKLLLFVFILCTHNLFAQQKDHYTIDLSGKEQKAEDMNLSSIASDINYITLETTKESYITSVFRLIKTNENILVLDYNNMKYTRLLIFDSDGSFKTIINHEGKGPGEYVSISDFTFDPVTRLITILDGFQRKVLQFKLSGEFVREKVLDIRANDIAFVKPDYFCLLIPLRMVVPDKDGELYNLFVMDRDFNLIKRIPSPSTICEPESSPYRVVGELNSYNGQLRLKIPFSETAYTFNKDLGLNKIIHFEMGKFNLPASVYSSIERLQLDGKNYKQIISSVESSKLFFIKYHYQNKPFAFVQYKTRGELINLSGKMGNFGIENDFDGSMKFWPKLSAGPDEVVSYYNAIDFIESCKKNNVRKFKSRFPAQQQKLIKILDKVDEESNPIIQIVKLK